VSAWDSARIALRALRVNSMRSLLTILGIVIGVSAVMTMIAVGGGARLQVTEQIRALGSNLLIVVPGAARDGGARLAAGSRHTLTASDAEAIRREVGPVELAAPVVWGTAQAVHGNRNWFGGVFGTEPAFFAAREWPPRRGRVFTDEEVDASAKVAVIGAGVAEQLFGDDDPLGSTIRIGDLPVTVVGVLVRKGPQADGRDQDSRIHLPISTAKKRLLGGAHGVSREAVAFVWVKVSEAGLMTAAQEQIRSLLRQRHRLAANVRDDFWIRDPAAAMAARHETLRTFTLLLASVASISLLVGGISIMNIMLVSVTERTREIGLRMAVGARQRDVLGQFLIESVTLCTIGGLLGLLVGVGASTGVAWLAGWPVFIGPGATVLAVGSAAAVGVFFGFYPALKASRLDPITALRFE
jgi:putative ABC transport system permease protein